MFQQIGSNANLPIAAALLLTNLSLSCLLWPCSDLDRPLQVTDVGGAETTDMSPVDQGLLPPAPANDGDGWN